MKLILLITILLFPAILGSLKNCPYTNSLSININSNDSSSIKSDCISDETCCFMQAKYIDKVGGFNGATCLPIDYDKNTSNYTYTSWKSLALTFCDDAQLMALNWTNIDYISDCECGYKGNSYLNLLFSNRRFLLIICVFITFCF